MVDKVGTGGTGLESYGAITLVADPVVHAKSVAAVGGSRSVPLTITPRRWTWSWLTYGRCHTIGSSSKQVK
jgi:hypothetical protein